MLRVNLLSNDAGALELEEIISLNKSISDGKNLLGV